MNRNRIQPVVLLTLMAITLVAATHAQSRTASAPAHAVVSGIVRDIHGTPQAGALVQLLAAQAVTNTLDSLLNTTSAFTDAHGRYVFPGVAPGRYQVRASAALFLPTLKDDLHLAAGAQAVVNLTLSTLFEATEWLPAQRRRADEPDDDWKWTLRSTVNRPILRLMDSPGNALVSSSATEQHKATSDARLAVTSGDGGFGNGGVHNIFTLDRESVDGSGMMMRADLASPDISPRTTNSLGGRAVAPAASISAGYQRRVNYNTTSRTVAGYASHPELFSSLGSNGMQSMVMESAEEMQLTPAIGLDVGAAMTAVHLERNAVGMQPFAKIIVRPSESVLVSYRMATSRSFQSSEDMNSVELETPAVAVQQGKVRLEHGTHHELAVGKRTGRGIVQAAYYHDNVRTPVLSGGGEMTTGDMLSGNFVVDPSTNSFRMVGQDYKGSGVSLSVSEPMGQSLWAVVEYSTGTALEVGEQPASFDSVATTMKQVHSQSGTVAVRGRISKTNTHVRAAYRWQPETAVTAVNPYHAFSDQAYFSFYVRQPLHVRGFLPRGTEGTIDVTNLLAQGYQPFLSSDGRTIYFAQAERTIQAGLSFTF